MFRVQSGGRMIRRPKEVQVTEKPQVAESRPPQPALPSGFAAPTPTLPLHTNPSDTPHSVSPQEARQLLRQPKPPAALSVSGTLNLAGAAWLHFLPDWLRCEQLIVDDCPNLNTLPSDLHAGRVSARRCPKLHEVSGRISVRESIHLSGSGVRHIRADLHASRLILAQCSNLTELAGAVSVNHLDLRGCMSLRQLPASLHVTQTLEVADSGLSAAPPHLRAGLRWNDVPVSAQVAFAPETLTGREVLSVRNVQHRRVLLERIGLDRFVNDVGGLILDADTDAGGERKLIRVPLEGDEDLVAVTLRCPSTGGQYVLRVPPHIRTCHQAVAWTAGLSAADYQPIQEA